MRKSKLRKWAIAIAIAAVFVGYQWLGLGQYLSIESLKANQSQFVALYQEHPFSVGGVFVAGFILVTALSLPSASMLCIVAGSIFGLAMGTLLASIASTIGAMLAFLASRFLFSGLVQRKFAARIESVNEGFEREGGFYLFTVRLIPLIPYFLVNLAMGLTPIRAVTFFFVSLVGMLPVTIAYVNAGTQLAKIDSLKGILSPSLIFSFALIGFFPLTAKAIVSKIRAGKRLGY